MHKVERWRFYILRDTGDPYRYINNGGMCACACVCARASMFCVLWGNLRCSC